MGLRSVISRLFAPVSTRSQPFRPLSALTGEDFAGVGQVTPEKALENSAFFAAVQLYTRAISALPLVTYRRSKKGGRVKARRHPAYRVLRRRPNGAMNANAFLGAAVVAAILDGEFFFQAVKDGEGRLLGLYPIAASRVLEVEIDAAWNKRYRIQVDGPDSAEWFGASEIGHVWFFSRDGVRGTPILRYASPSLDTQDALRRATRQTVKEGVRPWGYLALKNQVKEDVIEKMKVRFLREYGGAENAGKLPILTDGAEFKTLLGRTMSELELGQAVSAGVAEVARWFGISPLLLADLTRGTYSNLGAENLAFYQRALAPFLSLFEAEINRLCFDPDDVAETYYAAFLVASILRGDPQTQADVDVKLVNGGLLVADEAREARDLPAVPGFDRPRVPANVVTLDADGNPTPIVPKKPAPEPAAAGKGGAA